MVKYTSGEIVTYIFNTPLELTQHVFEPDAVEVEWDETEAFAFASIDDKEIYLWMPPQSSFRYWLSVVAHEWGHIITGGFADNPNEEEEELHEQKANHYENFTIKCYDLVQLIFTNK